MPHNMEHELKWKPNTKNTTKLLKDIWLINGKRKQTKITPTKYTDLIKTFYASQLSSKEIETTKFIETLAELIVLCNAHENIPKEPISKN